MKKVDIIFITNLPAFYKIQLWNLICRRKNVIVIFTGDTINERNRDFFKGKIDFDTVWLNGSSFQKVKQLTKLLLAYEYDKLILGGWDSLLMFWSVFFLSSKNKNCCLVESSIFESFTHGVKGFAKRLFLKRVSLVYACGKPQWELVRALGYRGKIVQTGGCGLLAYKTQPSFIPRTNIYNFLYVGRFVEVKNLTLLIEAFNDLPYLKLNIIGFGPLERVLKGIANDNITFYGSIENDKLSSYYRDNDVFILPSKSEVWGLVVEEALNNGTPVIVSDRVGCKDDLVTPETGIVFPWNDKEALKAAILKMTDVAFYNRLRLGVSKLNFMARAQRQIDAFLK